MLNAAYLEAKIERSGLAVPEILQELGLKHEETLTKQLRAGTIKISRLERLIELLKLTDLEAAYALGDINV